MEDARDFPEHEVEEKEKKMMQTLMGEDYAKYFSDEEAKHVIEDMREEEQYQQNLFDALNGF
jgi:hypothetical protein